MIDLILEIAAFFNEPLVNKMGQNRFGKHSWRATGAVYLGEAGVEIQKIMMVGRWHCSIVMHYTRNAPISDIAGDFKRARTRKGLHNAGANMEHSLNNVKKMVEGAAAGLRAEITTLNEKLVKVAKHANPTFVINRRTGRWHQILSTFADFGVEAMAYCGYSYALPTARVRFATTMPDDIYQEDIGKP